MRLWLQTSKKREDAKERQWEDRKSSQRLAACNTDSSCRRTMHNRVHSTTAERTTHAAHKHHSKKSQALCLIHPTANPEKHNWSPSGRSQYGYLGSLRKTKTKLISWEITGWLPGLSQEDENTTDLLLDHSMATWKMRSAILRVNLVLYS